MGRPSKYETHIKPYFKEIKEAQAEKERTRHIRQDLADFKQEVQQIDANLADEKIRRQMEKLIARRKRKEEKKTNPASVQSSLSSPSPATLSSSSDTPGEC